MREFITYDNCQEFKPLMKYLGLERVLSKTACYDDVLAQVWAARSSVRLPARDRCDQSIHHVWTAMESACWWLCAMYRYG